MKNIFTLIITLLLSLQITAQNINTYIEEGIAHHDNGEYDKALEAYSKALVLDPQSTVVNYEMALSYFHKKDYKNAIARADIVLDKKGDNMMNAFLIKGSALDMLGDVKESIKLFQKAIKKYPDDYLLYYNLALNYYKLREMDKAEENVIKAIEKNPNHSSSHWMLANIQDANGNKIQSLLANHYFLFLEPDSSRSLEAYNLLRENFGGNVTQDKDKPNTINVSVMMGGDDDDPFSVASLMLGLMGASNLLPENSDKTQEELFVENTDSFFKILGELKKKNQTGLYWDFYVPFFYDLANSDYLETYCMFISQIGNENAVSWLEANVDKLEAFDAWLKE